MSGTEGGAAANGVIDILQHPIVPEEPGTFRLGLVLNGTVSAGAWTAGVLDFLFEAMDLWEAAKRDQAAGAPTVPTHKVRLDVAGGASGGGVCAALLARAAAWRFPHVAGPAGNAANPFWDIWVEKLDIARMLDTGDLTANKAVPESLLSGTAIDDAGEAILRWPGPGGEAMRRPWIADPLHAYLTLTNLRGVPYRITLQDAGQGLSRASYYVDHADHILFAFPFSDAATSRRGDAHLVRDDATWRWAAEFAKATGAFPGGLPPRRLSRPVDDYNWRAVVVPDEVGKPPRILPRTPAWEALESQINAGDQYLFDCVDGGALNNQPIELVRTALAGLGKSNPRSAKLADAAVLLLDPFAAVPRCAPPTEPRDLLGVLSGLAATWIDHGRYATSDLLLSVDECVFSRFLLTPSSDRDGKPRHGGAALATSGLGAFLGFLCRDLRVHDFLLGRENCRTFLMKEFVLDRENPLVSGFIAAAPGAASKFAVDGGKYMPIIPVLPPLCRAQSLAAWPRGALDPTTLEKRIEGRAGELLLRLLQYHGIDFPFEGTAIRLLVDRKIANAAVDQINAALKAEMLA